MTGENPLNKPKKQTTLDDYQAPKSNIDNAYNEWKGFNKQPYDIKPLPKEHLNSMAGLSSKNNTIYLGPNVNEKNVDDVLGRHETTHWAQHLGLDNKQSEAVDNKYQEISEAGGFPNLETDAVMSQEIPEITEWFDRLPGDTQTKLRNKLNAGRTPQEKAILIRKLKDIMNNADKNISEDAKRYKNYDISKMNPLYTHLWKNIPKETINKIREHYIRVNKKEPSADEIMEHLSTNFTSHFLGFIREYGTGIMKSNSIEQAYNEFKKAKLDDEISHILLNGKSVGSKRLSLNKLGINFSNAQIKAMMKERGIKLSKSPYKRQRQKKILEAQGKKVKTPGANAGIHASKRPAHAAILEQERLPPEEGEDIHHLNGNRNDQRAENLSRVSSKDHGGFHLMNPDKEHIKQYHKGPFGDNPTMDEALHGIRPLSYRDPVRERQRVEEAEQERFEEQKMIDDLYGDSYNNKKYVPEPGPKIRDINDILPPFEETRKRVKAVNSMK